MQSLSKIIFFFFIINAFFYPASAQQNTDAALKNKLIRMYTWKVKEVKGKGYLMYLDFPYNLGNPTRRSDQYISMAADIQYNASRPVFITITLPDDVDSTRGLLLGFNNEPLSSSSFSVDKLSEVYKVPFVKHWYNNHTFMASLRNGIFIDAVKEKRTDIFQDLMHCSELYVLFYDSLGLRKMYLPLSFFQRRFRNLSSSLPGYSTGNPKDTALTEEEMQDRKVFDDGSMPTSWKIAGITNPIRLKHFIKYFRYLLDHNEKEKIAPLLVYPLKSVFPACKDSAEFVQNYSQVFDKYLRKVIDTVRLDELYRDHYGVVIGNGPNIIIRQMRNRYKISMISNYAFFKKKGWREPGRE